MKVESYYHKYNLKRIINASGKMTVLGVSKYNEKAIEAQAFGGRNFFNMEQLEINVGKYIADLIGAEDAQVVSSASAGIAQSVAALIGRGNQYNLYHPYTTKVRKREIIVLKGHNVDYGTPVQTMVELGGGELVEAGYANRCDQQLIRDVVTENTVAILYIKSHHTVQKSMPSVKEVAEVAKEFDIPLMVDAAAEQNLHVYLEAGSDLVIYSGAKAFEGTSSGLVIGKKEYITWVRQQGKGIGRAMKIGKENILGLAAAVEDYLHNGPESGESMIQRLTPFVDFLNAIAYFDAEIVQDAAGRDIYRAQVKVHEKAPLTATEIVAKLKLSDPAIFVRDYQANNGMFDFDIRSVNEEEMNQIVKIMTDMWK